MKHNTKILMITLVSLFAAPILAGCAEQTDDGTGGGSPSASTLTTCGNNVLSGEGATDGADNSSALGVNGLPAAQVLAMNADLIQQSWGELTIGSILPMTGALGAYGPDMKNGVEMAIEDLNAVSAGVNTTLPTIRHINQDSRSDQGAAPSAMNTLVGEGVGGVVGAASSGVTASILDIAVQNQVVLVTPASTSPSLTDPAENENNGFFYRVPPSDALQGQILGQLVYDDGCRSATIVGVNNPYGQGLARNFQEKFSALGGTVDETIFFSAEGTSFSSEIEQAQQAGSDAIVFIGYPGEGTPFMQQAFEGGLMDTSVFFFSEGVKSPDFVSGVGNGILNGLGGTSPASAGGNEGWAQRFEERFGHAPNLFAAESYDATIAIALAALAAGSSDGAAIKEEMTNVWSAPGVEVSDVATAVTTVIAGQDIDWSGPSGNSDWDQYGDPTAGVYSYWYVQDGEIQEQGLFRVSGGEISEA